MKKSAAPGRFATAYLIVVGLIYAGLGVWCAALPEKTSRAVGFEFASGSGRSEYLAVYGGLEIGLGAFFLGAVRSRATAASACRASILIHIGIVVFRTASFFLYSGIESTTKALAPVEWAILLFGVLAARRLAADGARETS